MRIQQLYNIADSLVAGKLIGENALAAVGTVLSMVFYRTSIYRQAEEKNDAVTFLTWVKALHFTMKQSEQNEKITKNNMDFLVAFT